MNGRDDTKFSTYAIWWIRQAIQKALIDGYHHGIRTPVHAVETRNSLLKIREELELRIKREATIDELSQESGISVDKIIILFPRKMRRLDEVAEDDKNRPLSEFIRCPKKVPEKEIIGRDLSEHIREVISSLSPREQKIIRGRFGFEGRELTLEELGVVFKVTRERIRQIEAKVLRKLKLRLVHRGIGQ